VTCHGPDLRGTALAPPIAGRSPSYLLRQLIAFRIGTRATVAGAPMAAVAAWLGLDEMIAVVAYAGSRPP
jgi:cytochrome c553